MKTFIKNLALVLGAVLLLALISYSWAEEKEVKRLKSITVYSYTPPSEETRYLQKIEHEGMKDSIFKFSQDGGKTWTTHNRNPVTHQGLESHGSTGNIFGDVLAGISTAIEKNRAFDEKYNTQHPVGYFYSNILSFNEERTRNLVSILKNYHDFIDEKSENNTPQNRLKFLKLSQKSISYAGDSYFDNRLKEIFKKLDSFKGDPAQLSEAEQSIFNTELEYLERDYEKWLSVQKALELYSKSLKPEEMTDDFLRLLDLYEVPPIDLVRQALETKRRTEAAATNSPQQECPKK
ncbi:MAG: hypothetical protein HYY61_06185 [Deltaproteobacteria bacterium]|nr:hypothetical protein [Deltaproteobacteria bacterium]